MLHQRWTTIEYSNSKHFPLSFYRGGYQTVAFQHYGCNFTQNIFESQHLWLVCFFFHLLILGPTEVKV